MGQTNKFIGSHTDKELDTDGPSKDRPNDELTNRYKSLTETITCIYKEKKERENQKKKTIIKQDRTTKNGRKPKAICCVIKV